MTDSDTGRVVNPCVHKAHPKLEEIGEQLARLYNSTLEEPNPDWAKEMLKRMK